MNPLRACLLGLALACVAATPPPPSLDELVAGVQKNLEAQTPGNPGRFTSHLAGIRRSLAQENFLEAEQQLLSLRNEFATDAPGASDLDELIGTLRARRQAAEAAASAAFDALVADVRAKITARAPVKDFDPLLERAAKLVAPGRNYYSAGEGALGAKVQTLRAFIVRWQDYLTQTAAPGGAESAANILNELNNLNSQASVLPRSELLAIQTEVTARATAAREARVAAFAAQLDQLAKRTGDLLDTAHAAAELDPLLAEIAKARPVNDGYNNNNNYDLNNRLELLRRFVQRWQEYLSQLAANNTRGAEDTLRSISTDTTYEAFYPRSHVLARLNVPSSTPASGAAASAGPEPLLPPDQLTFENLDRLASQLRDRRNVSEDNADLAGQVGALRSAQVALQVGNTQSALNLLFVRAENRVGPYAAALARLQQELVLRALALQLQSAPELKPAAGESPVRYLQRAAKAARDAQDWPLVYRVLQLQERSVNGMVFADPDIGADIAGYRYFFTALNQERAGLFTAAIRSYFSSLRNAGPNLPAEEIGRRLAALKQTHPQEFTTAETTPDPVEQSRIYYPYSGGDPRFPRPGMPTPVLPAPPPNDPAPKNPAATPAPARPQ